MTGDDQDAAARALIRRAMVYRSGSDSCNSVYMGGVALAGLYNILGLRYGQPGFDEALDRATGTVLNHALRQCAPYIRHMQDNPTRICPTCGGIMPDRRTR